MTLEEESWRQGGGPRPARLASGGAARWIALLLLLALASATVGVLVLFVPEGVYVLAAALVLVNVRLGFRLRELGAEVASLRRRVEALEAATGPSGAS